MPPQLIVSTSYRVWIFTSKDRWAQNAFLVELESKILLVDPGRCGIEIREWLLNHLGGRELTIVITHFHFDHVRDVGFLSEEFGAIAFGLIALSEVAIHQSKKIAFLTDKEQFEFNRTNVKDVTLLTEPRIRVFRTPGHTDCSVSYKMGDSLFVGDLICDRKVGFTRLKGNDKLAVESSLKMVRELEGVSLIYAGHGQAFSHIDYSDWYDRKNFDSIIGGTIYE